MKKKISAAFKKILSTGEAYTPIKDYPLPKETTEETPYKIKLKLKINKDNFKDQKIIFINETNEEKQCSNTLYITKYKPNSITSNFKYFIEKSKRCSIDENKQEITLDLNYFLENIDEEITINCLLSNNQYYHITFIPTIYREAGFLIYKKKDSDDFIILTLEYKDNKNTLTECFIYTEEKFLKFINSLSLKYNLLSEKNILETEKKDFILNALNLNEGTILRARDSNNVSQTLYINYLPNNLKQIEIDPLIKDQKDQKSTLVKYEFLIGKENKIINNFLLYQDKKYKILPSKIHNIENLYTNSSFKTILPNNIFFNNGEFDLYNYTNSFYKEKNISHIYYKQGPNYYIASISKLTEDIIHIATHIKNNIYVAFEFIKKVDEYTFNREFIIETDQNSIKEMYDHYAILDTNQDNIPINTDQVIDYIKDSSNPRILIGSKKEGETLSIYTHSIPNKIQSLYEIKKNNFNLELGRFDTALNEHLEKIENKQIEIKDQIQNIMDFEKELETCKKIVIFFNEKINRIKKEIELFSENKKKEIEKYYKEALKDKHIKGNKNINNTIDYLKKNIDDTKKRPIVQNKKQLWISRLLILSSLGLITRHVYNHFTKKIIK